MLIPFPFVLKVTAGERPADSRERLADCWKDSSMVSGVVIHVGSQSLVKEALVQPSLVDHLKNLTRG